MRGNFVDYKFITKIHNIRSISFCFWRDGRRSKDSLSIAPDTPIDQILRQLLMHVVYYTTQHTDRYAIKTCEAV